MVKSMLKVIQIVKYDKYNFEFRFLILRKGFFSLLLM